MKVFRIRFSIVDGNHKIAEVSEYWQHIEDAEARVREFQSCAEKIGFINGQWDFKIEEIHLHSRNNSLMAEVDNSYTLESPMRNTPADLWKK